MWVKGNDTIARLHVADSDDDDLLLTPPEPSQQPGMPCACAAVRAPQQAAGLCHM
jgi:hypothetical protein